MYTIGGCIRLQRKKKKLTIEKLSELADISPVFLREIERNIKLPSLPTFIRIINALDVSSDSCLPEVNNPCNEHHYNEITKLVEGFSATEMCFIEELIAE